MAGSGFDRRAFLSHFFVGGAAAAAGFTLLRRLPLARADGGAPKHLVVVFVGGGWDVTWALDPKPGLATVDAGTGTVQRYAAIPIASDPSRPSVDAFFSAWGGASVVVNGVSVPSIAHDVCWKHVLTGTPSETNPDLAAIAAWDLGRDRAVPYLVLGRTAFSGPYGAIAGRTGDVSQITTLLDGAPGFPPLAGDPPSARSPFVELPTASEDTLIAGYVQAATMREQATRGVRGSNQKLLQDLLDSRSRGDRLSSLSGLGGTAFTRTLSAQIDLAVTALTTGLSWSVAIDSGLSWDTHTGNAQQGPMHETLFAGLTQLAQKLDAASHLLDDTVVAVVSEMSRTPKMNAQGGKDHWPVTSALVFGGGVRGNRVLGGTDDSLAATATDPRSGASIASAGTADAGAQPLSPTTTLTTANLVAGLVEAVGADPAAHLPGVTPLSLR